MGDHEDLARRLHSAAIHLLRRVRGNDTAAGVGPAQLSALSVLVFGGERSLGQLASDEQVTPATMSRVVRALEDKGLARRRADPNDGRAVRIAATARGRKALERARRGRLDELERLLAALSTSERKRLEAAIGALERLPRADGGSSEG